VVALLNASHGSCCCAPALATKLTASSHTRHSIVSVEDALAANSARSRAIMATTTSANKPSTIKCVRTQPLVIAGAAASCVRPHYRRTARRARALFRYEPTRLLHSPATYVREKMMMRRSPALLGRGSTRPASSWGNREKLAEVYLNRQAPGEGTHVGANVMYPITHIAATGPWQGRWPIAVRCVKAQDLPRSLTCTGCTMRRRYSTPSS